MYVFVIWYLFKYKMVKCDWIRLVTEFFLIVNSYQEKKGGKKINCLNIFTSLNVTVDVKQQHNNNNFKCQEQNDILYFPVSYFI